MKQKEFFLGVTAMLPLLLGVVPFGLVFGVLGISSGLTETETILMSSIVFAGASQVVFAQLWAAGSAYFVIASSVALINLRHVSRTNCSNHHKKCKKYSSPFHV